MNLSYSSRIRRPTYKHLNPFIQFNDPVTYMQGNPDLKPEIAHSFMAGYTYKSKLLMNLGYTYTTDVIAQSIENDEVLAAQRYILPQHGISTSHQFVVELFIEHWL